MSNSTNISNKIGKFLDLPAKQLLPSITESFKREIPKELKIIGADVVIYDVEWTAQGLRLWFIPHDSSE